jgi:hypothetical protein
MKLLFYSIGESKKGNTTIALDLVPQWYNTEYKTRRVTYVFLVSGWVKAEGFLRPSRRVERKLWSLDRKYSEYIRYTNSKKYTKWDDIERRRERRRTLWGKFKELLTIELY